MGAKVQVTVGIEGLEKEKSGRRGQEDGGGCDFWWPGPVAA